MIKEENVYKDSTGMKNIIIFLGLIVCMLTTGQTMAKTGVTNPSVAEGIKLYKAQNYTESYIKFNRILEKDPSNSLANYYYAMCAARLGKKDEAISSYEKVIELSPRSVLSKYARKGKKCIETPEACHEPEVTTDSGDTEEDKFIKGAFGSGFSEAAKGVHEKQKIENLKRDINRQEEIPAQRFKEFKDFSSQVPSNDEIVGAIRVLQAAGLMDLFNTNSNNFSMLYGNERGSYDSVNALLNRQNGFVNNPQLIQSLLTTQMTTNF